MLLHKQTVPAYCVGLSICLTLFSEPSAVTGSDNVEHKQCTEAGNLSNLSEHGWNKNFIAAKCYWLPGGEKSTQREKKHARDCGK